MNKLVIITVCDFFECIYQIVSFYRKELDEADIIIVDDSKRNPLYLLTHQKELKCTLIQNSNSGDLRNAFISALQIMESVYNKKYDLIITNEHDIIPNVKTLYACLHIFINNFLMRDIASVSTIYKWNDIDCYPTNPDWYNGWTILNTDEVGECKVVGIPGVPFGFSLWKPNIIQLLNNEKLPMLLHLDSEFGKLIYSKGYHHIRLVDYYVEHYKRGVKSWKN
jgi:hypothetical protein